MELSSFSNKPSASCAWIRYGILITLGTVLLLPQHSDCWFTSGQVPIQRINAVGKGRRFGNSSEKDHFKLLDSDGKFILVGAKNTVYNISTDDFSAQTPILWPSTKKEQNNCKLNGKSKDECQNYIRVLAKDSKVGSLLICGTNAFSPKCRRYILRDGSYTMMNEFEGAGIAPYDPRHNSTSVYLSDSEQIYAGTVADFSGTDPLIYRKQVGSQKFGIRTKESDSNCLNEPNFVSTFADKDHVYFWFRESVTTPDALHCGKSVISRVARVCRNDQGGPRSYRDTWTTFLKAQLNCSLPGAIPFSFDQIESTSDVILDEKGNQIVYAVFNTPYSALRGSAVCAFKLKDIETNFKEGPFRINMMRRDGYYDNPYYGAKRPGSCSSNSRTLPDETVNFVKQHPLMNDAVSNHFDKPILAVGGQRSLLTKIAVDQVRSVDGETFDVLFIGTDSGMVNKVVRIPATINDLLPSSESVFVETIDVFGPAMLGASAKSPFRQPIENLQIYKPPVESDEGQLIAVSPEEVAGLPLHHCYNVTSCVDCVGLRDPYCAWETVSGRCVGKSNGRWNDGKYVQSVRKGFSDQCGNGKSARKLASIDPDSFHLNDFTLPDSDSQKTADQTVPSAKVQEDKACECPLNKETEPYQADNLFKENRVEQVDGELATAYSVESNPIATSARAAGSYGSDAIAMAVILTLLIAGLIGFMMGYKTSSAGWFRRKRPPSEAGGSSQMYSMTSSKNWATINALSAKNSGHGGDIHIKMNGGTPRNAAIIDAYSAAPKFNGEPVSMMLSAMDEAMLKPENLNNNSINFNASTLPKDYKVSRKTYI